MKVEYPVKVDWRGFHFQIMGKDNRTWFRSLAESGDTQFMNELKQLLEKMVEGANALHQTPYVAEPRPIIATPMEFVEDAPLAESNGQHEPKKRRGRPPKK